DGSLRLARPHRIDRLLLELALELLVNLLFLAPGRRLGLCRSLRLGRRAGTAVGGLSRCRLPALKSRRLPLLDHPLGERTIPEIAHRVPERGGLLLELRRALLRRLSGSLDRAPAGPEQHRAQDRDAAEDELNTVDIRCHGR